MKKEMPALLAELVFVSDPGSDSGCAGPLSLLFVQSIDYTRTRLGVDARNPAGQRQFSGIIDCYVKTVKADGLLGLYRGFWISCSCIFIYRYW